MRVLLDGVAQSETPRGVGRYVIELAAALARTGHIVPVIAIAPWQLDAHAHIAAGGCELALVRPMARGRVSRHAWHAFGLGAVARRADVDIVHLPDTLPFFSSPYPTVVTIHDVAEFDLPSAYGGGQRLYRRAVAREAASRADAVITVSRFSASRIGATIRPRSPVVVIPLAPGLGPGSAAPSPVPGVVPGSYLLTVGAMNRNKNLARSITAFLAVAPPGMHYVLAGPAGNDSSARELVRRNPARVKWLGAVSDAELTWLYTNARSLVFLSLYEGFGLPLLEAAAFGLRAVVSRVGALSEIAGEACIKVDPTDGADIARGLDEAIRNSSVLHPWAAQRVSEEWDEVASQTAMAYRLARAQRANRLVR